LARRGRVPACSTSYSSQWSCMPACGGCVRTRMRGIVHRRRGRPTDPRCGLCPPCARVSPLPRRNRVVLAHSIALRMTRECALGSETQNSGQPAAPTRCRMRGGGPDPAASCGSSDSDESRVHPRRPWMRHDSHNPNLHAQHRRPRISGVLACQEVVGPAHAATEFRTSDTRTARFREMGWLQTPRLPTYDN
jgi:hypothetical protein